MARPIYGGVEAGGTKWHCAVGRGPDDLLASVRIPTTHPAETIGAAVAFFEAQQKVHGPLGAVGIGCFGPVDLDARSPTYGRVTTTPKRGWANTDIVGPFRDSLWLPVGFDTDVNTAALGEARCGAARGLMDFVYLTVGTGIGGGAMVKGQLLHGAAHPEMGHVRVPRVVEDAFCGICPYHGDCLEGLASGPAIEARWGQRADSLGPDHPAWERESQYLAFGVANLICTLSPRRIILGGGVMEQRQLFPLIRNNVQKLLGGYGRVGEANHVIDSYIVPPALGARAGVIGAIMLAQTAEREKGDP